MDKKQLLLQRLDEIGNSLQRSGEGLALLGLGSVGLELARLDDYSDLDFFAIVKAGNKNRFIENLDWLSSIAPIAYCFKNTVDGYKLLYQDGVFCEFAIFEPSELANIPFSAGRLVWQAAEFDASLCAPKVPPPAPHDHPVEWLVGEAITNLYVGMCRYRRGEKLTAARFIQNYAVDRIIDLSQRIEAEQPAFRDIFTNERRYEQRFPTMAQQLPQFIQGYENSPASAKAILAFLDQHFGVNAAMKQVILDLC